MALQSDPAGGVKPKVKKRNLVSYQLNGKIRDKPVVASIHNTIEQIVREVPGISRAVVFSGGQDAFGTKNARRTGSRRHDNGRSADIWFYDNNGKLIRTDDSRNVNKLTNVFAVARREGMTGIGMGPRYMGGKGVHIGYGSAIVWGENGRSANAPQWLKNADQNFRPNTNRDIPTAPPTKTVKRTVTKPRNEWTQEEVEMQAANGRVPTKTIEVNAVENENQQVSSNFFANVGNQSQQKRSASGGFIEVPGVNSAASTTGSAVSSALGNSARNRGNAASLFGNKTHNNSGTQGEQSVT